LERNNNNYSGRHIKYNQLNINTNNGVEKQTKHLKIRKQRHCKEKTHPVVIPITGIQVNF
jgi:hypothetical protein